MSQPKSVYTTNLTRTLLLAATLLTLAGCESLQSSQNEQHYLLQNPGPNSLQEKKGLYALNVEQTIKKGQWLISEVQLHQALKTTNQHSFLTSFYIRHYSFEQKLLANDLVKYTQISLQQGDTKTASRCYQTLKKLQVPDNLKLELIKLSKALSLKKVDSITQQQNMLGAKLDKSIQQGQLIESSQLISKLQTLKLLSKEVLAKIDKAKGVLAHNTDLLNEKADLFYRDGNVQLAKSLWEYLLKFDPENRSITSKLSRANRVLKNIHELRENPINKPPTHAASSLQKHP